MKSIISVFALFALSLLSYNLSGKEKPFWPADKSPQVISQKVFNDFFTRNYWIVKNKDYHTLHYAEACAGFGIARLAGLLKDTVTIKKLSDRYLVTDSIPLIGGHVDGNVYGILPLELYKQTGNEIFREQGLKLANHQWENPLEDGLSNQTRFWIDDIWMIGSLQTQAYRVTHDPIYLERAALELAEYIKRLQQPNGLFYHGLKFPFHWGRGNGWVAAGLAEVLSELPETNPNYPVILEGYKKMMKALLKYQAPDGMWRQLIDKEIAWKETSSTAMFGYAMTLGVKSGILKDKAYKKAYQKAWLGLTGYLGKDGKLTEVCAGTGQQNDINFYLNRPRIVGDFHGQAPLIWLAWSLLLPDKKK